jgi:hypothetical protein
VVVLIDIWPRADRVLSFESGDGGGTWGPACVIAQARTALDPTSNPLFFPALSDAEDADGTIYLAWQDCRFRAGCSCGCRKPASPGQMLCRSRSAQSRVPALGGQVLVRPEVR